MNVSGIGLEVNDAEREALHRLSSGEAPSSQRAAALLALAGGAELEDAAATSGLTVNQARFWLGRFRSGRLAIFPDDGAEGELQASTADISPPAAQEIPIDVAAAGSKPAKKTKKDKKRKETKKKGNAKKKKSPQSKKTKNQKKDGKGKKKKGNK